MTKPQQETTPTPKSRATFWSALVRARSIDASRLVEQARRRSL